MSNPRIYDYPTLCATMAEWINRSDLVSAIPDFVRNVELICNRQLRTQHQLSTVQAAVPTNTRYIELPGDFEEAYNVMFVGTPIVQGGNYTPSTIGGAQQNDGVLNNPVPPVSPKGFTFERNYVSFYPAPSAANTLELQYYASIPPLDDYLTINWLLTRYPDIYLYGALAESAPYLNNDDRIQTWAARFSSAFSGAQQASDHRRVSGGPINYRPRPVL